MFDYWHLILPRPDRPTNRRSWNLAMPFLVSARALRISPQKLSSLPALISTTVPSFTSTPPSMITLKVLGSVLFERQWLGSWVHIMLGLPVRISCAHSVLVELASRFALRNCSSSWSAVARSIGDDGEENVKKSIKSQLAKGDIQNNLNGFTRPTNEWMKWVWSECLCEWEEPKMRSADR